MSHQIPEGLEPDQNPPPIPPLSDLVMADKTFMSAGRGPLEWGGAAGKGEPWMNMHQVPHRGMGGIMGGVPGVEYQWGTSEGVSTHL